MPICLLYTSKDNQAIKDYYKLNVDPTARPLAMNVDYNNAPVSYTHLDVYKRQHDNSFDVVYDIDDSILKYETLNLILQPLLENAIGHGLDVKTDGRGEIRIEGDVYKRQR